MTGWYPPAEPYDQGLLDVGDGHLVYGETCGNPDGKPAAPPARDEDPPGHDTLAFVRLTAHYYSHGGFLEDGAVIRDAGRLAGIPGVIIHGRLDLSCPVTTAVELARAWPGAELLIDDRSGHRGSPVKRAWMLDALSRFASR